MEYAPGFGIAWHAGMDVVWEKAKDATDPIELAKEGYRLSFGQVKTSGHQPYHSLYSGPKR